MITTLPLDVSKPRAINQSLGFDQSAGSIRDWGSTSTISCGGFPWVCSVLRPRSPTEYIVTVRVATREWYVQTGRARDKQGLIDLYNKTNLTWIHNNARVLVIINGLLRDRNGRLVNDRLDIAINDSDASRHYCVYIPLLP